MHIEDPKTFKLLEVTRDIPIISGNTRALIYNHVIFWPLGLRTTTIFGHQLVPWPSWLRRGANNAKISSSILLGTISFFAKILVLFYVFQHIWYIIIILILQISI